MIKPSAIAFIALLILSRANAQTPRQIAVATDHLELLLTVNEKGKLYQSYLGEKLRQGDEAAVPAGSHEAYIPSGTTNLFEPAIGVTHADGNPSLELLFKEVKTEEPNGNEHSVTITLKDPKYPFEVLLHIAAYNKEDIFKSWTEIRHQEKNSAHSF